MVKKAFILRVLVGAAVALGGSPALAGDWPQWGGSDGRNMVSDEKPLPDSFVPGERSSAAPGIDLATTKNVKWVARLGGYAYGNPTVAGGRVFVGTDCQTLSPAERNATNGCGLVKCLDEATGKLLWQLIVPKRTDLLPGVYFTTRIWASALRPTVDGDRVYAVTSDDEVVCLDVHGQPKPTVGSGGPRQAAGRAPR